MKIYIGQTRSKWLVAKLAQKGWGECVQPNEIPPRRHPWFFDNGAFKAWKADKDFDGETYAKAMTEIKTHKLLPEFLVVPDIVAGGTESLKFSAEWIERCQTVGPCYLAIQDGMRPDDVLPWLRGDDIAGLFIGGTLEWKLKDSWMWNIMAKSHGKACHVGRVGTPGRVGWAKRLGVDSIDSCLPLWSRDQLRRFEGAVLNSQMEFTLPRKKRLKPPRSSGDLFIDPERLKELDQ